MNGLATEHAIMPVRRGFRGETVMLLCAFGLMAVAVAIFFLVTYGFGDSEMPIERPYLIPWVLGTGVVIGAPLLYLKYKGDFSFANPIVLAAFFYFIPVFFLGGWSLTFGLSYYYYLAYITDPQYNFPLAFVYIMLGFAALAVGFFIPFGRSFGNRISRVLPKWDFTPTEIVISSVFCLTVGICLNVLALELGQIGYQTGDFFFGGTGSIFYYLTIVLPASSFLLWLAFFKFERWNVLHVVIILAQLMTAAAMLIVMGGKSSLILWAGLAIAAFVLLKRQILFKHWVIFTVALFLCLIAGTIYGTKFRELKGGTARVSAGEYSAVALESIASLGDDGVDIRGAFHLLAHRLEIVSALAVVVSNYEALAPYEAAYGLENNIWTYTWTALIPRFIWKDKPVIADGYSYNELYFDYGGFGLSLTVMGDLLRNFGPVGVPLGMLVLGFAIRIFYAALIEGLPFSAWRSTVYFIVMTKLSYDGFYGEILPTVIRVSAVVFMQLIVLRVIIQLIRRARPS